MSKYIVKKESLINIADAIRNKFSINNKLTPSDMADAINIQDEDVLKTLIERKNSYIILPESITSIGAYAFRGCNNLALTSLPESITSIGAYAFAGCRNLALTSLPESITSIENYAFTGCSNLKAITFKGTPTTINSDAFNIYLTTINVPWAEGAVAGAPWGATNATITYNYTGV